MDRRKFLIAASAALIAAPGGAQADPVEQVVAQLRAQGYSDIIVSRTLLGRARIVARDGTLRREVILNRATGEILRDFWEPDDEGGRGLLDTRRTEAPEDDDDDDDGDDDGDGDGDGDGGGGGDDDD